jgi:hypothetical protein
MPFDAPFSLGPFVIDDAGRLSPDLGAVPSFRLAWRGRAVQIAMRHAEEGARDVLRVTMALARIPSTAPTGDMTARENAFALLRRLPAAMPDRWTVALSADHRIMLHAEAPIELPASAASLVTELTLFLLAVDPYLTALEEAGLGFAVPAAPVGIAKT